ncbi:MAG: excinuclease ABC subunit B [Pseudomonadota bacterium]
MTKALILLIAATIATPAAAWEFSTEANICLLRHGGSEGDVRVTYAPGLAVYGITVSRGEAPWEPGAIFAIQFQGPRALTISTNRQQYSGGGRDLSVTDRGFGNVLNGLEFNTSATAILGNQTVRFDLRGAAPEVRKFRACTDGGLV